MIASALPRLAALILLLAAAGALALGLPPGGLAPPPPPPAAAQTITDYDTDDDGLIDINSLDQLNAIRWDLNGDGIPAAANTSSYLAAFPDRDTATSTLMGCPSGACRGYELMADLTFSASSSDPHTPFTPIGSNSARYGTVFEGNGHTLTNLTGAPANEAGLFGALHTNGVIRNVGLINPEITSGSGSGSGVSAGALVGVVWEGGGRLGQVIASYVSGGRVRANGNNAQVGGLVGENRGQITASYSTAAVSRQSGNNTAIGGLVGAVTTSGRVNTSYAAGAVSGPGSGHNIGGLFGRSHASAGRVFNSYWDTVVTTRNNGRGGGISTNTLTAHTTTQLQTPTGYTGIYENWNVDVDGDLYPDDIWDFGTTTTYPTLKRPAQWATVDYVDYDTDDNGLIEVGSLAQLDAMRHDLDGNGAPASTTAYEVGFPTPYRAAATRMGCPGGQCRGYELTASLTLSVVIASLHFLKAASIIAHNPGSPYPPSPPQPGIPAPAGIQKLPPGRDFPAVPGSVNLIRQPKFAH